MPATKAATPGQRLHRSSSTSRSLGTSPKPALGPTSASASTSGSVSAGNDNVPVKSANPIAPGRGTQSLTSATAQSSALVRQPSLLSKPPRRDSSTTIKQADQNRERERLAEGQDAGDGTKNTSYGPARATPPSSAQSPAANSAIDPLSQHIFMRTHTDHSVPQRLRNPSRPESPLHMPEGLPKPSADPPVRNSLSTGDAFKDKSKRGSSFLSRLSMRGSRKKELGDFDTDSEVGSEARMDGANARVFSQAVGYIPHHKEPPKYIRTKAGHKKEREFNRVFLAQELVGTKPPSTKDDGETIQDTGKPTVVTVTVAGANGRKVAKTGGAIWATEFSKDGKYLATAGRDHVVRIWAVISTPEERRAHEEEEAANGGTGERLSAPVFRDQPMWEFEGHTGEVLDLSWSKNNFLLSSSMDKTVRLWHISRKECLCTFKHKDFVTRLAFHPSDDRFFLAGSLDTMLRLWSIPDKTIAYSAQLPDLITAVAFSPDGKTAIAGLLNGLCLFYETEGLKLQTQIHVRSSRGKNAKGSKITGIQTMSVPMRNAPNSANRLPSTPSTSRTSTDLEGQREVKILITSNDSRIRIYSLRDKSLDVKLKGHVNSFSQIAATFSDDGKYVICGSEDRRAFVWNLAGTGSGSDKDKSPYEYFEAHGETVTTAVFAPTKTRTLLGQSEDPVYDLCNPPPVVLRGPDELASAAASQTDLGSEEQAMAPPELKRPEPSPAYIARSSHRGGNIIVTTDDSGIIKVFRQDCAYAKRRHDNWETGSTFSRKLNSHGGSFVGSGLGRSMSVMTRTSAGSGVPSRRGSLSQSATPMSPQLGPVSASSDRILSWRQGIEHVGEKRNGSQLLHEARTPSRSERSVSPAKIGRSPLSPEPNRAPLSPVNTASEARKQQYAGSSPVSGLNRLGSPVTGPTASVFRPVSAGKSPSRPKSTDRPENTKQAEDDEEEEPHAPPTPSFTFRPAKDEESGVRLNTPEPSNYSFWNLNRWRGLAGFKNNSASSSQAGDKQHFGSGHARSASTSHRAVDGLDDKEGRGSTDSAPWDRNRAARRKSFGVFTTISAGNGNTSATAEKASKPELAWRKSMPLPSLLPEKQQDISRPPTSEAISPAVKMNDENSNNNTRQEIVVPTIINTRPSGDYESDCKGLDPSLMAKRGPSESGRSSPYKLLWSRGNPAFEESDIEEEEDLDRDAVSEDEETARCGKCGAREFKAKKVNGKQRMACAGCGAIVDCQ